MLRYFSHSASCMCIYMRAHKYLSHCSYDDTVTFDFYMTLAVFKAMCHQTTTFVLLCISCCVLCASCQTPQSVWDRCSYTNTGRYHLVPGETDEYLKQPSGITFLQWWSASLWRNYFLWNNDLCPRMWEGIFNRIVYYYVIARVEGLKHDFSTACSRFI